MRLGARWSSIEGTRLVWDSKKYWLRLGWESPQQERSFGDSRSLPGWGNLWFHSDLGGSGAWEGIFGASGLGASQALGSHRWMGVFHRGIKLDILWDPV
jgi:hypothetical protein